jgi:hypothetical protein
MPIKSKAQRRKFAQLLVEGKISPETFEEWNRGAGKAELPERLHPKKKTGQSRKKKTPSVRAKAARSRASTKKRSKPRRSTRATSSARKRR